MVEREMALRVHQPIPWRVRIASVSSERVLFWGWKGGLVRWCWIVVDRGGWGEGLGGGKELE